MRRERSVIAWVIGCLLLLPSLSAAKPPKLNVTSDPPRSSDGTTLSGTLIKKSAATTSWYLYPGACVQRALGTWAPKSSAVADSLQPHGSFPNSSGYTDGQPVPGSNTIGYTREDLSTSEKLWRVADASTPSSQRPAIIDGSRSLWCGKYDPAWTLRVGYPNQTYQILYLDTGAHGGNTTLRFEGNVSTELSFDYLYVIGGGTDPGDVSNKDPLQNRRDYLDEIISTGNGGPNGDGEVLVAFTGSIQSAQSVSAGTGTISGAGAGQPITVSFSISGISDRAVYLVLISDSELSAQDGLWPEGNGIVLDLISVDDNGTIYNDQVAGVALDPYNGTVLAGTYGSFGCVSARTPAGLGELWQLAPGTENPTSDPCAVQKTLATDLFFEGGDPVTNLSLNKQSSIFVTCTVPIVGAASSVIAQWNRHMDMPRYSGLYQVTQYRYYKEGAWSDWRGMSLAGGLKGEALQAWGVERAELAEAAQADSVQLRFGTQCIPSAAANQTDCSSAVMNALLFDDLRLEVVSGVPAPVFGIAPASLAQTTFIDGTQARLELRSRAVLAWDAGIGAGHGRVPQHRHSRQLQLSVWRLDHRRVRECPAAERDGDQLEARILEERSGGRDRLSGLRVRGDERRLQPRTRCPADDLPAVRPRDEDLEPVRLHRARGDAVDRRCGRPRTRPPVASAYQVNWPPYDKSIASASLPGEFTVNGITAYNGLRFLPRGARTPVLLQGGGHQRWRELPVLAGHSRERGRGSADAAGQLHQGSRYHRVPCPPGGYPAGPWARSSRAARIRRS